MDTTLANPSPSWPFLLVRAIAALLFGIAAVLLPGAALASMVLLFSAYLLVDGVFAVVAGVRAARRLERWGWFALEGVANIAAGVATLLWPGITVLAFVLLAGAWALASGGAMLFGAARFRQDHGRGWLVLGGLVSLVWGAALLVWPGAGALALTLWLGIYALAFGFSLLFLALRLRREARRQPLPRASTGTAPPPDAAG